VHVHAAQLLTQTVCWLQVRRTEKAATSVVHLQHVNFLRRVQRQATVMHRDAPGLIFQRQTTMCAHSKHKQRSQCFCRQSVESTGLAHTRPPFPPHFLAVEFLMQPYAMLTIAQIPARECEFERSIVCNDEEVPRT
jgi:hypothetical protein